MPAATYRFLHRENQGAKRAHKNINKADLSADQLEVYSTITRWLYRPDPEHLLTLGGYAGTGKSTLISVLGAEYATRKIAFCAYTGRATSVLRSKLGAAGALSVSHTVSTIHRLIYYPKMGPNDEIVGWGKRASLDHDLLVVDEASMVSGTILEDLLSFDIPILAVGDHGQLPPIEGDFNLMESPMLRLEKIHRQAEASPVLQLATHVRQHGDLPLRLHDTEKTKFVPSSKMKELIGQVYGDEYFLRKGQRSIGEDVVDLSGVAVLCYTNAKRGAINHIAREACFEDKKRDEPYKHDQVICLKNADATIFNGMRGYISAIEHGSRNHYKMDVRFPDEGIVATGMACRHQFGAPRTLQLEDLRKLKWKASWADVGLLFDYGYGMTVHKAQGSQFENLILVYERPVEDHDNFRRWLYTAISRCSDQLTVVVD